MRKIYIFSLIAFMMLVPSVASARSIPAQSAHSHTTIPTHDKVASEVAERVRSRALFASEIASILANFFENDSRQGDSATLVEHLWLLRLAPEAQRIWLGKLSAASDDIARQQVLQEFHEYMAHATGIAYQMGEPDLRRNLPRDKNLTEDEYFLISLSQKLEQEKKLETFLRHAVSIMDVFTKEGLSPNQAVPYFDSLAKMKGDPERLKIVASLIKRRDIPDQMRRAIFDKLAADPKEAMASIDNIAELQAVYDRYRFVLDEDRRENIIKMPLATVAPKIAAQLSKTKTLALAASSFKRTSGMVTQQRLVDLPLFEHKLYRKAPGGTEAEKSTDTLLSFLNPGERLYIVLPGDGYPMYAVRPGDGNLIFRNTPLAVLDAIGPKLLEYSQGTHDVFTAADRNHFSIEGSYLIAATCGPEELAAHLASLSVVHAAREQSLYGPFEDFTWSNKKRRLRTSSTLIDHPVDSPGRALRLMDIQDPDIFMALASVADNEGLARLMGPIRGVWVKTAPGSPEPWKELRYSPRGATSSAVLGKSPILELDKDALKSIVASKKSLLVYAWATYSREKTAETRKGLDRSLLDEETKVMEKKFNDLEAKGFVSPWDMGSALYFINNAEQNNPELVATLEAIVNDKSLSSAKRIIAMEDAFEKKR